MNETSLLPLATLASSAVAGVLIFFLGEERHATRTALNIAAALAKLGTVGWMLWGVLHEVRYESRLPFLPGNDLLFRADALTMLFATLSALLWLVTTIYAVGYMEGSPHRSRFFGFFSLCVTATMGIAMAGNLITFFVFYELLTLATYPLVVHRGTPKALAAGAVYLAYTLTGGALLLAGTVWLHSLAGTVDFTLGGVVSALPASERGTLTAIFVLLILGVGVKAALVPLHGWLPQAMVAPAPVSALLHAVAVVKAGAFGIVRIVYDVYGIELSSDFGLLLPLAAVASLTIVYGSLRAIAQDDLKRRLAYSTVSQVAYIALGVGLFGPIGSIGGLVHLFHQGIMKITLFFCAGNYAETLGIHKVSEMGGVGRRMPWTTLAFTVAAFGMIGIPPSAGFISKWYLGLGAVRADMAWAIAVLVASSLLNAAYFLPILHAAWFRPQRGPWPEEHPRVGRGRRETGWLLLAPPLATAAATLAAGVLAGMPLSPLEWAKLIISREYLR